MRALEQQAQQQAIQTRQRAEKARSGRPQKSANPVTQLRREIMPLVAQLVELAAGDESLPALQQPEISDPKNGAAVRRRRRSASGRSRPAI